MKVFQSSFLLAVMLLLTFSACEKDPCDEPDSHGHSHNHSEDCTLNEPEVLTTLRCIVADSAQPTAVDTFLWRDVDGAGGKSPRIDTIRLQAQRAYTLTLQVLDESDTTKVKNITVEILAEALDHQFFFSGSAIENAFLAPLLKSTYRDTDSGGQPIGIVSRLATNVAGKGDLTIALLHKPNKSAAGVAAGSRTNAGGETDLEVTLPVVVQ